MHTTFLTERFAEAAGEAAIVSPAGDCSFGGLLERHEHWANHLTGLDLNPGTVVGLRGDFTPNTIALFLALADRGAIVAPERIGSAEVEDKDRIAEVEACFEVDGHDRVEHARTGRIATHEHYVELRRRGHPGLVGFSSGTSGEPKAAVHDLASLLDTFRPRRTALSTFAFLLFDHLGGIRTMLHALANTVPMVATRDRSPETICTLIEGHRVELLPATPTFFNLLLLSGAHRRHDLSSLRVITYGAEPMPQSTLDRLRSAFPDVKLQQTYGMIEIGPLSTRSRADGSLWVKVGGEGFETRVVDGVLQVRSSSNSLGYLNAPTPVTPDGWFVTGDAVAQEGEYLRFLGRASEQINVGGEKVSPPEVESVIQAVEGIEEATVFGEPNGLMGQIVCARVHTGTHADERELVRRVKSACREKLDRFKVPVKVVVVGDAPSGERIKKSRRADRQEKP